MARGYLAETLSIMISITIKYQENRLKTSQYINNSSSKNMKQKLFCAYKYTFVENNIATVTGIYKLLFGKSEDPLIDA